MPTIRDKTKDKTTKQLPVFSRARCKRCGICSHFCPVEALAVEPDGMPYLADADACTSCALCSDMCPDWAIYLTAAGEDVLDREQALADETGVDAAGLLDTADHERD